MRGTLRAAAVCAGTDSEGTSVQVWMNYEPTQKTYQLCFTESESCKFLTSIRSIHRAIVLRPSKCQYFLRTPIHGYASPIWKCSLMGEQNINDYAERPASALAGGQLKKLWWLSLLKRLTSRFPSIPQQAQAGA